MHTSKRVVLKLPHVFSASLDLVVGSPPHYLRGCSSRRPTRIQVNNLTVSHSGPPVDCRATGLSAGRELINRYGSLQKPRFFCLETLGKDSTSKQSCVTKIWDTIRHNLVSEVSQLFHHNALILDHIETSVLTCVDHCRTLKTPDFYLGIERFSPVAEFGCPSRS